MDHFELIKPRVLIADSDKTFAADLAELLEPLDFVCKHAKDDKDAFTRFLEFGPDVVVVDTLLPRRGGFELIERIRKARGGNDVAVYFTSAFSFTSKINSNMMETLGAAGVLQKPADKKRVHAIFEALLANAHSAINKGRNFKLYFDDTPQSLRFEQPELPGLIAGIVDRRESCRIVLEEGKVKKAVYFKDGELEFCSSNLISETLGRYLLNMGEIDESSYRKAIEVMLAQKRRMGEVLVSMNATDQATIDRCVVGNVMEKFFDIFSWTRGTLRVLASETAAARLPVRPPSGPSILWTAYADKLHDYAVDKLLTPLKGQRLKLDREIGQWRDEIGDETQRKYLEELAQALDGQRLGEVTEDVENQKILRTALYLLARRHMSLEGSAPGDRVSADDKTLHLEQEKLLLHRLRALNAFAVLGVGLKVQNEGVRAAYLKLAARYHPDSTDPEEHFELHQTRSEIFIIVNEASGTLETQDKRDEYRGRIEDVTVTSTVEETLSAEAEFQEGMALYRKRLWGKAAAKFEEAVKKNSEEPDYCLLLGLSTLRHGKPTNAEAQQLAIEHFQQAHSLNPHFARPLFEIGKIANIQGDNEKAVTYLVRALRRAPKDTDILRELRLIQSRGTRKVQKLIASLTYSRK